MSPQLQGEQIETRACAHRADGLALAVSRIRDRAAGQVEDGLRAAA
ncbi:MAG TPA: hypothetical protein VNT03_07085 [Baekduia sp.]|nr:hypothetical protein [Baekduia sp.]